MAMATEAWNQCQIFRLSLFGVSIPDGMVETVTYFLVTEVVEAEAKNGNSGRIFSTI